MRLAVISPFLDARHGTERCVLEQLKRFPAGVDTHIYSERLEDLNGAARWPASPRDARFHWHKTPELPGPHILKFCFWFLANRVARWRDARFRGLLCDVVFSPGINALDADVIIVHIVFREMHRRLLPQLRFGTNSVANWPLLLHRRLYYRLIMALEDKVYRNPAVSLIAVSGAVASQLQEHYARMDVRVILNGVDLSTFAPGLRLRRRAAARAAVNVAATEMVVLLIGNDWKKKGLVTLLEAFALCRDLPLRLLVVGTDARGPFEQTVRKKNLASEVLFLSSSPDVMQFYAAADIYAGPSLEDAYALPIIEAMACGLPVIASARAGASEIITDAKDGLILRDPQDANELAIHLRRLAGDARLREELGKRATETAQQYSWERNAAALWDELTAAAAHKKLS